jgi:hypothetical protein
MAFDFGAQNDSSDEEAITDISAWQTGAKTQRATPPRRTSGFQAVNQPVAEDIAMQSTPEPEPEPQVARPSAPVAQMQPTTEPTVISSGEESSSDEEDDDASVAPVAQPLEMKEAEDDIWATVDEVVGDFAAVEEEEAPHAQQPSEQHSDSMEEDDDQSQNAQSLEVVIPRDELEDEDLSDCVDLTAGGDIVRRVLNEREDRDGMMEYTVEFEDYHVDEVSLTCDFTSCEDTYKLPILSPTSLHRHQHHDCCYSN